MRRLRTPERQKIPYFRRCVSCRSSGCGKSPSRQMTTVELFMLAMMESYPSTMAEKGGGGSGGERWKAAIMNLSEMGANLDAMQKLLAKKAVFVDEETFAKASLISEQARTIKVYALLISRLDLSVGSPITLRFF
ncbi:hypothetical protein GW17_00020414 [Ensete ventricosum]|nr:hypothetical protein GW17_00020414 [Ensete ventricosum]RZS17107.1 hypothetical protein BHM03_00049220 [Ensete ventricosum]